MCQTRQRGKGASRTHQQHINSGHVQKTNLCKGCLLSEGPRKIHKRIRDVDKATHVLHIDIARPYIESHEGHHYFLVGALRLPDQPLIIDVRLLKTRTSVEVCAALERMTSFFESLSLEWKVLRLLIHPASRDCTQTEKRTSLLCTSRSSCPITAVSITPSPDVSPLQDFHKSSGVMQLSMPHRPSSAHPFRRNKDHHPLDPKL